MSVAIPIRTNQLGTRYFTPRFVDIVVGETITWYNAGKDIHSLIFDREIPPYDIKIGDVVPVGTLSKRFDLTTEEALSVLKEWVELHGKPMKVMHDGGKEFTSTKFKNFLNLNGIKDKQIPKGYPQEQGKVEAYIYVKVSVWLLS